jgi:lysophospholipase L1-like esterase
VKVLFWGLLLAVIGIGAAIGGEAATRWRERHRPNPPGTMPTLYYPHHRLRPALVRNHDYFGWIRIDSFGLRGRNVPLTAPVGTIRILADGGSTTFDTAVSSDDSTWPAHLERILSQQGDRAVQVLNAGVPGYLTLDNLIRLQSELYRLKPDVVVLMQGHNDLYDALIDRRAVQVTDTPGELHPPWPWGYWLARNSLLYGQLAAAWRAWTGRVRGARALPPGDHILPLDSALMLGAERFQRDLTSYVLIARQLGARVILVEPVTVSGDAPEPRHAVEAEAYGSAFPGVPPALAVAGYRRYRDVVREVARENGADLIATGDMGLNRSDLYDASDPMHLNDAGARLLAERLAERVAPLLAP